MKFWKWLLKVCLKHLDKNEDGVISILYDIENNTIVIN